jgi:transitional endoplasmic reticulum ATPase
MPDPTTTAPLTRTVAEGLRKDAGRAVVRLDPADLGALGLAIGDTVAVEGERRAVAKALPLHPDRRGQGLVQLDGVLRANARVGLGDAVALAPLAVPDAARVVLQPVAAGPSDQDLGDLGRRVDGLPVQPGDRLRVTLLGSRRLEFTVQQTRPAGPVLIAPRTKLRIADAPATEGDAAGRPRATYEDIGGLGGQVQRVRELIELPLRAPGTFARLGIAPPTGVLLSGPPGCGKTLLARTIAAEADAAFFAVSGPEVIRKHYGESEAELRRLFEQAAAKAPSIVFLDEIDALAPRRDASQGEVEKRVVATLLTLMDGMAPRQGVVVIAATNRPDAVDPALRRAGRFDREIAIPIPDRTGRREILAIHSRGMPLAEGVDLGRLAETTHGFVGADLEALCREAAMAALRRALPDFGLGRDTIPTDTLATLEVTRPDFQAALREVQPSATREVFTEVPDVRWDDVGGLAAPRARLMEAVEWPLRHADLFAAADLRPAKGILLAGPPGCGKTLLAQAAATESQVNFIAIKGAALLSKYVGESERKVREVFRKAREAAPCLVFFDEIDALAPTRRGRDDSGVAARVLAQLLTEIDGIEELRGVVVLAATNRRDLLDPALLRPGRFDEIIDVDVPDADARRAIFDVHLRRKPVTDAVDVGALVDATAGFSGAEIADACRQAALAALRAVLASAASAEAAPTADALAITPQHLADAVAHVRRTRHAGTG